MEQSKSVTSLILVKLPEIDVFNLNWQPALDDKKFAD
jgi:hypothetical protein